MKPYRPYNRLNGREKVMRTLWMPPLIVGMLLFFWLTGWFTALERVSATAAIAGVSLYQFLSAYKEWKKPESRALAVATRCLMAVVTVSAALFFLSLIL